MLCGAPAPLAVTTSVGFDAASCAVGGESFPFVAVTTTRSRNPMSELCSVYVVLVAPPITAQLLASELPPSTPHFRHWNENDVTVPDQAPGDADSRLPSEAVPEIVGSAVLTGGGLRDRLGVASCEAGDDCERGEGGDRARAGDPPRRPQRAQAFSWSGSRHSSSFGGLVTRVAAPSMSERPRLRDRLNRTPPSAWVMRSLRTPCRWSAEAPRHVLPHGIRAHGAFRRGLS